MEKFTKMIAITCVIIVFSLLKGGKGVESIIGLKSCGFMYWFLNVKHNKIKIIFNIYSNF